VIAVNRRIGGQRFCPTSAAMTRNFGSKCIRKSAPESPWATSIKGFNPQSLAATAAREGTPPHRRCTFFVSTKSTARRVIMAAEAIPAPNSEVIEPIIDSEQTACCVVGGGRPCATSAWRANDRGDECQSGRRTVDSSPSRKGEKTSSAENSFLSSGRRTHSSLPLLDGQPAFGQPTLRQRQAIFRLRHLRRALRSARVSTLKKCLTGATLSATRFFGNYSFEIPPTSGLSLTCPRTSTYHGSIP
jgi:hypothetical protein